MGVLGSHTLATRSSGNCPAAAMAPKRVVLGKARVWPQRGSRTGEAMREKNRVRENSRVPL
jgi:hypothetical protein